MRVELQPIKANYHLELVHMDYLIIELGKGDNDVNILIIIDNFMRYAQTIVMNSQTANVTAQDLWDKFIIHYGLPEHIILYEGKIL